MRWCLNLYFKTVYSYSHFDSLTGTEAVCNCLSWCIILSYWLMFHNMNTAGVDVSTWAYHDLIWSLLPSLIMISLLLSIMISSLPTGIMVSSPLLSDLSLSYIKHNQVILPYIAMATLCTYIRFLWYIYIDTQLWFPVLRLYINITDLIEFPQFSAWPDCPPHHMSMSNSHYMCTRRLYVTITQNRSHILHRLIIIRRKTFLAILIRMCDSKSVYTQLYDSQNQIHLSLKAVCMYMYIIIHIFHISYLLYTNVYFHHRYISWMVLAGTYKQKSLHHDL